MNVTTNVNFQNYTIGSIILSKYDHFLISHGQRIPNFFILYRFSLFSIINILKLSYYWHIAEHPYLGRILLFSGYPSFVVATSWTEVHHKNLSSSSTKNCLDSLNVETGNIYVTEFPPQDQITTQFLFFLLTTFVFVP